MKLTKPQLNELLDLIYQVNDENAHGTESMQRTSYTSTLGIALLRAIRPGIDSEQATALHDAWDASAPRYDFSGQ